MKTIYLIVTLLDVIFYVTSLDNGVGITPPMGWSPGERFRCNTNCYEDPENCISERLYMEMADVLYLDDEWKYTDYKYVIIGDCWSDKTRMANGTLQSDAQRFPSGIQALADYMHGRGLKLGIYADIGQQTCNGYPGSAMYLETDAKTFAQWGVDYVQMDACDTTVDKMRTDFPVFGDHLNKTSRPILYSCSWPKYEVKAGITPNYTAIAKVCNTWKNYEDIQNTWDSVVDIVDFYSKNQGGFLEVSGPGQYNDAGELLVGDFGLSIEQQRAQMAIWSLMGSALIMSNDLRKLPAESKKILLDVDVLRGNQDQYALYVKNMMETGDVTVWIRSLYHRRPSLSYALLNRNNRGGHTEVYLRVCARPSVVCVFVFVFVSFYVRACACVYKRIRAPERARLNV